LKPITSRMENICTLYDRVVKVNLSNRDRNSI